LRFESVPETLHDKPEQKARASAVRQRPGLSEAEPNDERPANSLIIL
jgi:hypothetical protein